MTEPTPEPGYYLSNTKLISLLVGIVGAGVTAFCAVIYNDEQTTAAALNAHIIDAATKAQTYVRKDDLDEINQRLQRIEDKLDNKADKVR
jgi:hypothetical protein